MTYLMYLSGFSPRGLHQPQSANGMNNATITGMAQLVEYSQVLCPYS